MFLTDKRAPYTTELDRQKAEFATQVDLACTGQSITDVLRDLSRAEQNVTALHKEIDLYKRTWIIACKDITELETTNRSQKQWSAAWKSAARTWRTIAKYNQAKLGVLYSHIDTQNDVIRELHEKIGYLKAEIEKK